MERDGSMLIEQARQLVIAARAIVDESRRVRVHARAAVSRARRTLEVVRNDRADAAIAKPSTGPHHAELV
jgi:hypothetical protein